MKKVILTAVFVFAVGTGVSFAQTMYEAYLHAQNMGWLNDNPGTTQAKRPANTAKNKTSSTDNTCWVPPCDPMVNFDVAAIAKGLDETRARQAEQKRKAETEKAAKEEAAKKDWENDITQIGYSILAVYDADRAYAYELAKLAVNKNLGIKEEKTEINNCGKRDVFRVYTLSKNKKIYTTIMNFTANKNVGGFWQFDAVKEYNDAQYAASERRSEMMRMHMEYLASPAANK